MFSASTAAVLSRNHNHPAQIEGANFLNLLIVEDDRTIRESCREVAQSLGFNTQVAESAEHAYRLLDSVSTDAVLLDLRPGAGGLDALHAIKKHRADALVIVVTGHGTVQSAVQAMKDGAYDYVTKPFSMEELRLLLERVATHLRLKTENRALRETIKARQGHGQRVGREVDSLRRHVPQQAVHSGRLRVARAHADRKRTVRPRARRLHGSNQSEGWLAGDRRWGHGISGRDWRTAGRLASQAVAGDSGEGNSSRGKREARSHQRTDSGRDQSRPGTGRDRGHVPPRSLLPAERADPADTPVARAPPGHPAAGGAFSGAHRVRRRNGKDHFGRVPQGADELRLARKRARTRELAGARVCHQQRQPDSAARSSHSDLQRAHRRAGDEPAKQWHSADGGTGETDHPERPHPGERRQDAGRASAPNRQDDLVPEASSQIPSA